LPEEGLEQLKVAIHDLTDCLIDAGNNTTHFALNINNFFRFLLKM